MYLAAPIVRNQPYDGLILNTKRRENCQLRVRNQPYDGLIRGQQGQGQQQQAQVRNQPYDGLIRFY